MSTTIKTRIIKIGNSHVIRIPKALLEQYALGEEVTLELKQDRLIVHPIPPARQHWEQAFQAMHAQGDDILLDGEILFTGGMYG